MKKNINRIKHIKCLFTVLFVLTGINCATGQSDTTRVLYSWKLSKDYLSKDTVEVDTSLSLFHVDNPIYSYSFGNAYLGNTNSPVISQLFFSRYEKNDFYYLNYYYPYMETVDKTCYFNTRKQFSKLTYISGGSSSAKEEMLEIFHTQNVSAAFNFGLKFNTIASIGQYLAQKTRRNTFKAFYSYESEKLNSYFSVNTNNFTTNENGGIINDTLLGDITISSPGDIPTHFGDADGKADDDSDVKNQFKTLSFELVNNVNLLKLFSKYIPDSLRSDSIEKKAKLGIITKTGFESYKRIFYDIKPLIGDTSGFYDTLFFNNVNTFDSIHYKKFYNSLRAYFSPYKRISVFFGVSHELINYYFHTRDKNETEEYPVKGRNERPFYYQHSLYNLILNSGLSFSLANLYWNFTGDYYLSGYQKESFDLYGDFSLRQPSGKYHVTASLDLSYLYPDFLYQNFYSNSLIWRNNFHPVKKMHWSINYGNSPNKIESEINYAVLRGQIYFDSTAFPRQWNGDLQVASGILKKDFKFWKISFLNKVALQYVSNQNIIDLPTVVFENTTFFQQRFFFKLTGGELFTILGLTMNFNSRYYIPAYMPHSSSFYNQNEKKYGNYPYVDIFLNVKLKRARFFFKFEHINSGLFESNYFSVLHYPRNDRSFKVGISWNFYD